MQSNNEQPPGIPDRAIVPTHTLIRATVTPPPVDAATLVYGRARWPWVFISDMDQWKRDRAKGMVDIDLIDPRMSGRAYGTTDAAVKLHVPYDLGRQAKQEDVLVVVVLPANDPRTLIVLDTIEEVWEADDGR